MSLVLGKKFNRSYNCRIDFLDSYYNIGIFFNKRSNFVLFSVDTDYSLSVPSNVNMFKNLEASMFCETFLNLHTYRKSNLDIINQFHQIKSEYCDDVNFLLNETIILSKINLNDKIVYDTLNIYGLTLGVTTNEFIFIIAERQNINQMAEKKFVRTTALQISTKSSTEILQKYHKEFINNLNKSKENINRSGKIINLNEIEEEEIIKFKRG